MLGTHTSGQTHCWLSWHSRAEPSIGLGSLWGTHRGLLSCRIALQKRFIDHVSSPSIPSCGAGAALPG